jgi:hypothetical protein
MQRSGYEALEAATPLVTSPMRVLKDYFRDAAVYAEPTADGILVAVRQALAESESRREKMASLLKEKSAEQDEAMSAIKAWMYAS